MTTMSYPVRTIAESARYLSACEGTAKMPEDVITTLNHMRNLMVATAMLAEMGTDEAHAALKTTNKKRTHRTYVISPLRAAVAMIRLAFTLVERAQRAYLKHYGDPASADPYKHIVYETGTGLASALRLKQPHALCGASLRVTPNNPDPGPDGPDCPKCLEINGGPGKNVVKSYWALF